MAVKHMPTNDITEHNDLVRAVSAWIAKQLALKKCVNRSQEKAVVEEVYRR